MYALDVAQLFEGFQGNHHHDGGAVGVGNDAARTRQGIFGVAFRHHQGNVFVHAEGRRVVDHDSAKLRDVFGIFLRHASTS